MKKILLIVMGGIILIAFLCGVSACATLFNEKNPAVNINSDPDGAKVYVNGNPMGTTPVTVKLKNNVDYTIEFRKDGFETRTYILGKHVGGHWVVLDIITGFLPVIIDMATGSWYELDTTDVRVLLESE